MRKPIGVLVALTLALGAAACSSSGSSPAAEDAPSEGARNAASASSPGSAASAAAGDPIPVGVICTCSGKSSTGAPEAIAAAKAWVARTNEAGGVKGHKIELTVDDDAGDPGKALISAKELTAAKVVAIIDVSTTQAAWAKTPTDASIPVLGSGNAGAAFSTNPNFYPAGQTHDSLVYAEVATAKKAGATKVAELYCLESPVCQENVAIVKSAASKLGLDFAYSAAIGGSAPNFTAQCVAAKQAGADALILDTGAATALHVANDCHTQGYDPAFVSGGGGYAPQTLQTPGGIWLELPMLLYAVDDPIVDEMNAALDKYAPGVKGSEGFTQKSAGGWVASLMLGKAIEAAGVAPGDAVTAGDVTRGLNTFKDEKLDGWSPGLTFEAGKPHPVNCWLTARVQDGKISVLDGGKQTCE